MDIKVSAPEIKGEWRPFGNLTWAFGHCSNNGYTYKVNSRNIERCCLERGMHTLSCYNSHYGGWYGMYIEIQGHQHCDDFMGYTAMRKLNVKGGKYISTIY